MMIDRDEIFESILNDAADLIRDGFRRPHLRRKHPMRTAPVRSSADSPDATEEPVPTGGDPMQTGPKAGPSAPDMSAATSSVGGGPNAGDRIRQIVAEVATCTKCRLSETRTHTVPGEGAASPLVMVVGEGPGADEDRTGRPFVGRAGKYLDKWLEAIGLSREENCYIANIVKCRPPGNRDPRPDESESCMPYLQAQIDVLKPKVILTVGRIAIQNLLGTTRGIGKLRGGTFEFHGVPVIPTYHPSGVLRNPEYRQDVWDDLRRLQQLLEGADA